MLRIAAIAGIMLLAGSAFVFFALPAERIVDALLVRELPSIPTGWPEGGLAADSSGYLVIAPKAILELEALRRFTEHKAGLGFSVSTVSAELIDGSYSSGELADKIRQYLKDNAGKLGLRFVLLVGDPDPADVRVKLPVEGSLPPYVVSAPSRSIGGSHVWDSFDGEIGASGQHRLVVLTGPNLQVLRPGKLRYWYVNCTRPGKIRFVVARKKESSFRQVFAGTLEEVTEPGVAMRPAEPVYLEAGDFVGFELPQEGGASVAAVNMPGTACAQSFELNRSEIQKSFDIETAVSIEAVPLIQCDVYFEPQDRVGSLPSKMSWPMGTYNGVYGALLLESCLAQCPTDAYFANLSGDWDANSNGFYGETFLKFFRYDGGAPKGGLSPGDFKSAGDAFLPELLVGRIPFDDHETVAAVLQKTIAYETARDTSWRRHCLLAADPLAPDTNNYALCEFVKRDICEPAGFKSSRFYTEHDFEGEIQSPKRFGYRPETLVSLAELNGNKMAGYERFSEIWSKEHPGFVLWSSHGNSDISRNIMTLRDETSTVLPAPVTRRYTEKLDDSHPAIVFSTACSFTQSEEYYLGARKKRTVLEHDWETRPNLGRELLKNGAVAVVGHTRGAWFSYGWDKPDDGGCLSLAYDFADRLLGGESVGYSLAAALHDYNARWGSELADGENVIGFVIYGDPSLALGLGRKQTRPLIGQVVRNVSVRTPARPDDGVLVRVDGQVDVEIDAGTVCEIPNGEFRAGADRSEEWFDGRGFVVSDKRTPSGRFSYYSGTARHRPSTLTLNFPVLGGQRLTAAYQCWFSMEPGLDYAVFEKSPDGRHWEPLAIHTGASTDNPLFEQEEPAWKAHTVEFSVGVTPAYLRFRYVTNDQYRKTPHEGFYVDNFTLNSASGGTSYISGWQKMSPGEAPGIFRLRSREEGPFFLRISSAEPVSGRDTRRDLYRLEISEPRPLTWAELTRKPRGQACIALAISGLALAVVFWLLRSRQVYAQQS